MAALLDEGVEEVTLASMDELDDGADLVDRVRTSCARLAAEAKWVRLDEAQLDSFAALLLGEAAERGGPPSARPSDAASEPPAEDLLMLTLALDAINFGSGYHDVVRKKPGLSGARTMAASLTDYVSWTGELTPERLQAITVEDCSSIFGQDLDGGALTELMSRFALALNDLGRFVASHGSASAVLEAADHSAVRLAELLTTMPYYRDVEQVALADRPAEIAFYKRAQITPADLARDVPGVRFDDLHRLTAFADNLVPHVLRIDGVLQFDPELAAHIDRRERLEPGGRPEVEIRALGVHAVELLSERTGWTAMDLDLVLWERGSGAPYKAVPRHRARSVFY